jgi:hypothetical protein
MAGHCMEPLSWRKDSKLLQSPLLDLRVGRAFLLTKGRNAWHSTWIRRYQGSHAVHGTLDEAKRDAESKRGPGNVFYIRETPVLALDIEDMPSFERTIVLTDFYADDPFAKWSRHEAGSILELDTPIGAVLNAFSAEGAWLHPQPNPHSLIVASGPSFGLRHFGPVDGLHSWTSSPQGSHRPLRWVKEGNEYVFDGALAVEQQFIAVNTQAGIDQRRADREAERQRQLKEAFAVIDSWGNRDQDT